MTVVRLLVVCGLGLGLVVGCAGGGRGGGGGGSRNGNSTGGDGNVNGDPLDEFRCNSPGGQDVGVVFGEAGTTRVVASTLGLGRHLVLSPGTPLIYEFDQPVRFCAVVPSHFTLMDLSTGTAIGLAESNLQHQHIVDEQSDAVVGSRVIVTLPASVQAGRDYQLTISDDGLSLDGEFQVNAGTALAANGLLPSGDGVPGGDFVQIFRAITITQYLTATPSAGGMAVDRDDRLYIVGEGGAYGPFDAAGAVTEGRRLGENLGELAPRIVLAKHDGNIVVLEQSGNIAYEIDPASGAVSEIAQAGELSLSPQAATIAPAGYASVELAGVEPGDLIFADSSGVSALDLGSGTGLKGRVHFVERDDINSAYLNLWTPPRESGSAEGSVYGAFRPESFDEGFQIHRILPNGLVDRAVLPAPLPYLDGSGATHLQDVQGRREFAIVGAIDLAGVQTHQIVAEDFDGLGLFVYDATRDRIQIMAALPVKTFAFDFAARSQIILTSDFARAYVSMPLQNLILAVDGLANSNPDGDWPCDSIHDAGIDFGPASSARLIASTLGRGRHLLRGAPTVVEFEFDVPLRYCQVNADAVELRDLAGGAVALDAQAVNRAQVLNEEGMVERSRVLVDLPDGLIAGREYQLTLSAAALGLAEDVVQTFQLVEGSLFLTETQNAAGIAVDGDGRVFIANEDAVFGPFTAPDRVTLADVTAQTLPTLSGGGRPIGIDAAGRVIVSGRSDIVAIDPDSGAVETIASGVAGSFEVDVLTAPTGFDGAIASSGDVILFNSIRGVIPTLPAPPSGFSETTTLFTGIGAVAEYVGYWVPPTGLFGAQIYGALVSSGSSGGFTVERITPGGQRVDDLFSAPLEGVAGLGALRLQDNGSQEEWLLLADYEAASSPMLPTEQTRSSTEGLELLVYNATTNRLQVLGFFSRGVSDTDIVSFPTDPDLESSPDLDAVYLTQPVARTVVRLDGFAN